MPEPFWKEGDAGWKHPNWETHALFADVVATALQTAEWQAGCVSPVSDQLGSVPRARDGSSAGAEHGTQAVSTERPGLPDRVQETTLVCMQESSGTEGLLAALSVRDGQVIPTPSHFLEHISPIFPPFSPRVLRVFTVSTRRFQRAASRYPGHETESTPFCRAS